MIRAIATGWRRGALAIAAAVMLAPLVLPPLAQASDMLVFKVEMKDGAITPDRIEVEQGKAFRFNITNAGSGPAEFESNELHKEKVLTAGATGSLIFRSLSPGTYVFYDDFHPDSGKLTLIVK